MSMIHRKLNSVILLATFFVSLYSFTCAQGINYLGNSPLPTAGAGNARTDSDNLFTRNNAAGMTKITPEEDQISSEDKGKWRVMFEGQGIWVEYRRRFMPFGSSQEANSETLTINPNFSAELTYTPKSRRYAFGFGLYHIFGNQSKLKDERFSALGLTSEFDTKVASNDFSVAGSVRLHKKLSVGGTFILGRGFLVQNAPIPELAAQGIIKQSRLDVSSLGAPGASFGIHFRPLRKSVSVSTTKPPAGMI